MPHPGLQTAGPHNSHFLPPKLCQYHLSPCSPFSPTFLGQKSTSSSNALISNTPLKHLLTVSGCKWPPPRSTSLPSQEWHPSLSALCSHPCPASAPFTVLLARKPAALKHRELCLGRERLHVHQLTKQWFTLSLVSNGFRPVKVQLCFRFPCKTPNTHYLVHLPFSEPHWIACKRDRNQVSCWMSANQRPN